MTEFNPGGAASLNQAVKLRYESNADTNAFTDAEKTKLAGVSDGATVNASDADLRDRASHTGTQTAATISDLDTAIATNSAVVANSAKVSNATHTGDVVGDTALTIADDAVTYGKMQEISAPSVLLGRGSSAAGNPEEITLGSGLTMSGTTLSASGGGGSASPQTQTIQVSGRWYCFTDNRWVGFPVSYGSSTENYNQGAGTGANPSTNWIFWGPSLMSGAQVNGFRMLVRGSHAEVGGMDLRVYLSRGPWDGSWGNNGATTWDPIYSADAISFTTTNWTRHIGSVTPFTCPDDGHLLIFVRATGTVTATRFIYGCASVDYEMPV